VLAVCTTLLKSLEMVGWVLASAMASSNADSYCELPRSELWASGGEQSPRHVSVEALG
jgi:hypothetical protein